MARLQLSDLDFNSVARILNLPDGTLPQHPATVAQLQAAIEGMAWKDNVRVASTANINLAAPGASIDGVAMTTGDRFLAKNQTTVTQNGIYIWNGAAVAATRALDASTFDELENAFVPVDEGTANAGTTWRQTQVNGTIGSDNVVFASAFSVAAAASETAAGIAEIATQAETDAGTDDARFVTPLKLATYSGRKLKYETTIGDGSATQYTVTHNLGTRGVTVAVYRNSGSYDEVNCDVEHTTANSITLRFANAPTSNQYAVVVLG